MGLTLQEVLERALKKLNGSSFERFKTELNVWELKDEYVRIKKNELRGKGPEELSVLISKYYKYAYAAEVTLAVLLKINERKVQKELQCDLKEVDITGQGLGTATFTDRVNFIERHKEDLITRITDVDPVLFDLKDKDLLTQEQYKVVMGKKTSKEKIEELCDIISHWEDTAKFEVYKALWKYNEEIIKNLEMRDWMRKNVNVPFIKRPICFTDYYRPALIRWITSVDPVLHDLRDQNLLTEEQYKDMMEKTTSEEKMEKLWDIISCWEDIEQYKAYLILRDHNENLITNLEMMNRKRRSDHYRYFWDITTSPSRQRWIHIRGIMNVDPVLRDLRDQNLLTEEQYNDVMEKMTSREKMEELCDIISKQEDYPKYMAFYLLKKYNKRVIEEWERKYYEGKITYQHLVFRKVSHVTEKPQQIRVNMTVDRISCKHCGKEKDHEQKLVEVVSIDSGMYRLELKSPGLYRCHKTGIKFLVKGPVIIEYKPESWSDHLKDIADNYEILGPLFNIRTRGDPSAVSAVHLPHYLCIKDFSEDTAPIKCAHFQDGNMTLMKPSQIDPFSIILENPTFSCLGPLLPFKKKKLPIHGIVLIYFKIMCKGDPAEEYRIHLYVLPHTINAEENLDKENKKFGFQRIKKPEQTIDPVYMKVKYSVMGHPGVSVCPETVKFQSERYNYTEIQLREKDVNIFLYVFEKSSEDPVWEVRLTKSDINDIHFTQLLSQLTICKGAGGPSQDPSDHFLNIHYGDLIDQITMVDPVLDDLLSQKLITHEQYKTVRSKSTTQKKMRKLHDYISEWENVQKKKVITALKRHNPSARIWKEECLSMALM